MEKPDVSALARSMIEEVRALVERLKASFNHRITELESKHAARIAAIPAGPRGDRGERGERGLQGPKGEQGQFGAKGERGPQGVRGEVGAAGPQGERGLQGLPGSAGVPGPQGGRGDPGPPGPDGKSVSLLELTPVVAAEVARVVAELPKPKDGAPGAQGPQGEPGARGADGVRGEIGARGADGALGPQGERGADGAAGERGADGASGAAGPQGERGPEGPQGAQGPQGERGADGQRGEAGPAGASVKGDAGPQGERGAPGERGPAGEHGAPGADGKDVDPIALKAMVESEVKDAVGALPKSQDGKNGADGRDAAELDILPSIDEAKSYRRGTWASHNGGLIRAARQTDAVKDGALIDAGWVVMVEGLACPPVFSQGEDPREFFITTMNTSGIKVSSPFRVPVMMYREIWRDGCEYDRGDVVTWGGSAWHCQQKTTDRPKESPAWRLMVKEGARGKDAAAAAAGPRDPVRLK